MGAGNCSTAGPVFLHEFANPALGSLPARWRGLTWCPRPPPIRGRRHPAMGLPFLGPTRVQVRARMSPTCTAVQAPPRAVDLGKSSGSVGGCRASRADQVLLRITPSFSARGAAVLGCRAARAEMLPALAACNVRHAHCLFGKARSRHPCAPDAGRPACPRVLAVVPRVDQ